MPAPLKKDDTSDGHAWSPIVRTEKNKKNKKKKLKKFVIILQPEVG